MNIEEEGCKTSIISTETRIGTSREADCKKMHDEKVKREIEHIKSKGDKIFKELDEKDIIDGKDMRKTTIYITNK